MVEKVPLWKVSKETPIRVCHVIYPNCLHLSFEHHEVVLLIMAKLETSKNINVKMENVKKKLPFDSEMIFASWVSLSILLSKNQMSKNMSHFVNGYFSHFPFFHNRRKGFMLGFAAGLIDETCNLQLSFKQNQKIFYADIRCIWNFFF